VNDIGISLKAIVGMDGSFSSRLEHSFSLHRAFSLQLTPRRTSVKLKIMKRENIFLSLILLFSAFLQFYQLGELSLWEDEAQVALKSLWSLKSLAFFQKNFLLHTILSSWIQFGKEELWLRIPSVIFALFTLIALYEVGKKLFSPSIALLGTFLLSLSPFFILESRQAKMIPLAMFLSLLSLYFLLLYYEEGRLGALLSHFGVSCMAFLTHYMFLALFWVECLMVLSWFRKKDSQKSKKYFKMLFLLSFLLIPLLPDLIRHCHVVIDLYLHPETPESFSFPMGYFGKVAFVYYLFSIGPTVFPWNFFWVGIGAFSSLALLLSILRFPLRDSLKISVLGFLVPLFLLSLLKNAQPRYTLVALPFYTLLLALGFHQLRPFWGRLFLSIILLVNAYGIFNYFHEREFIFIALREPYREIVQFIRQQDQSGDLFVHSQQNPSFLYYYYDMHGDSAPLVELHEVQNDGTVRLLSWEVLKRHLPHRIKRIWYVERPPGQFLGGVYPVPIKNVEKIYEENLDFRKELDRRFKRIGRWTYLKDPDTQKKEKFLKKFYLDERIVISLYDLTSRR